MLNNMWHCEIDSPKEYVSAVKQEFMQNYSLPVNNTANVVFIKCFPSQEGKLHGKMR